ncbi:hypothetical protein KZX37_02305 [Microbacterium sp. EYE_5]|uniref:hypothetical protein n=1 Tax=unclassified Microbacterium TaxID=2609290 RepID=UPI002006497F|nr:MULTISPECIES: hypothetical protein [unclassified Microbacterium]MCK6079450.1 hypothetical protein [Microbacterium sp. EYE_382]MCK6084720.1 hypothetical protein [Microbacterium sp. EYE_384]MCK6123053.1 hypothetical protein [Microbacterium sp. EYE_80]MCK6125484.1 hypothetical protein [Microbacterium sp. EYE_79]MCK6140404.1 hypothetical protein [Microbacterium sp. EYE_39]
MTTHPDARRAPARSEELGLLYGLTGVAFAVGLVLLLVGLIDTSPGWDDAAGEAARRGAQVVWGVGVMALGFVSLVGALVLSAIERMLAAPR